MSLSVRGTLCVLLMALVASTQALARQPMPHLRDHGDTRQLVVDGRPFLMLGGELGNSSASSLAYMESIWPRLADLNLNTVLAPVYWELVEPTEGAFDFSSIDGLIEQARAHDMRLVLLWFGSWKNSMSSYAPAWVKRNQDRFPRARRADGIALEILTPFSDANARADARAFGALMAHLADVDGDRHTVVMVQVENEIGMIPEARDRSPEADSAYRAAVPADLLAYLERHRDALHPRLVERWTGRAGTWAEVFGAGAWTDEIFMAWHFARYVEQVTAAGKAVHPLPMYVNAALVRPGYLPGAYPSAGPLPHLIDVWRAGAPSIDFLAPDIYFPDFVEWTTAYDVPGNPVFIPEAGRAGAPTSPADAFYAFGARDAMGYSPFSIEDEPAEGLLGATYDVLRQLAPLITERQGTAGIAGVRPPVSFDGTVNEASQVLRLGRYVLEVSFVDPWTPREAQLTETHGGLIVALDDETFMVAGTGITITFSTPERDRSRAGVDTIEEGSFVEGVWVRGRVLNGDQSHQGRHLRLPPGEIGIQRVRLYRYR